MNKILLIAAPALLAIAWTVNVQLSDNSSSDSRDNPLPQPIVTALDTNHNGIAVARVPHKGGQTFSFAVYQRCRQDIDNNFQRLTSLRQIAMECHLSVTGVSRAFQRYGHQNPYQYLLCVKKNQAARLLRQSQPVSDAERQNIRDIPAITAKAQG
ncbi:MAG TPA: AraC family transcriptional regulator [Candidatus Saccharimonadales bacterium]|jgi:AraC-like DNA-binding protein|nr:AraC family transcriptional regulator [Candidatus Saccharimonadales bacterium]